MLAGRIKSMNILYLLPILKNTGPGNVVMSLVKKLKADVAHIYIVSFYPIEESYRDLLAQSKDGANIQLIALDGFTPRNLWKIRQLIKEKQIDVLHSHGLLPDLASKMVTVFNQPKSSTNSTKKSLKTLSTIHCNLKDNYQNEYRFPKGAIYYALHKIAICFIDQIISVSENARPFKSARVIYNGVEPKNLTLVKNTYPKQINLIYAGRLIESKNIVFLLECFAKLPQTAEQPFVLHIFGDGDLFAELKMRNMPNVIFYGFVSNYLEKVYENSIMVNPSLFEGMPMAVIEALSAGLPVLLSSISAHQEINHHINHGANTATTAAENNGVYLFENNADSFNNALFSMLSPEGHLKVNQANLRQQFANTFSDQAMVAQYLKVYTS